MVQSRCCFQPKASVNRKSQIAGFPQTFDHLLLIVNRKFVFNLSIDLALKIALESSLNSNRGTIRECRDPWPPAVPKPPRRRTRCSSPENPPPCKRQSPARAEETEWKAIPPSDCSRTREEIQPPSGARKKPPPSCTDAPGHLRCARLGPVN